MKERCYGCMKPKQNSPKCEHCGYDERSKNGNHQLPVGTVVGQQYVLGKVLGQGGFGITYIGWDRIMQQTVAVKEYFPSGYAGRDTHDPIRVISYDTTDSHSFEANKRRFLREAEALAKLWDVPQIVRVLRHFEENGTAYIAMEYVEGEELKKYLQQRGNPMTMEEILDILGPVMEALEHVHGANLVHRDISPDNIMVLPDGSAKLLDFGAARYVQNADAGRDRNTSTQAILKHGFAPPEQYRSHGALGPWTDVYAMCATIYFCMTGKVPAEAMSRVIEDSEIGWGSVPGLTKHQMSALNAGMALKPKNRIQSVSQLYQELFGEILSGRERKRQEEESEKRRQEDALRKEQEQKEAEQRRREEERRREQARKEAEQKRRAEEARRAEDARRKAEEKQQVMRNRKKKSSDGRKWRIALAAVTIVCAALWGFVHIFGTENSLQSANAAVPEILQPETAVPEIAPDWYFTYEPNDIGWTITGYEGMLPEQVNIPERYEGKPVTSIGSSVFRNCTDFSAVTIPESITSINNYAFAGCTGLTAITIPDSVTSIGQHVFQGCTRLVTIVISDNVTALDYTFYGCTALTSVTIPDSVTSLNGTFRGCTGLTSVTIPESVTSLDNAFYDCTGLTTVAIPGSVTSLNSTFSGCTGLISVTIPESVTSLDNAFYGCIGLTSVTIPNSVTSLNGTFRGCTGLTSVTIPDSVISLGVAGVAYRGAFYGCTSLTSVTIPDSVTSICSDAFYGCTGLISVTIPDSVTSIGWQAFYGCTGLTAVTIPRSVTEIKPYAFGNCTNLKTATIPGNCRIGYHEFPDSCTIIRY